VCDLAVWFQVPRPLLFGVDYTPRSAGWFDLVHDFLINPSMNE